MDSIRIFIGGHWFDFDRIILEYNPKTEEWIEIGKMKEKKFFFEVSVVLFDDYADWCQ